MNNCLLCHEKERKAGFVCGHCANALKTDVLLREKFDALKSKLEANSKSLKNKLQAKPPNPQKKADRYIRKVAALYGQKVKAEKIFGIYLIDIYLPGLGCGVEIDGGVHTTRVDRDDAKDIFFKKNGIKIIRFENDEVGTNNFKKCVWSLFHENYMARHNKITQMAASMGLF